MKKFCIVLICMSLVCSQIACSQMGPSNTNEFFHTSFPTEGNYDVQENKKVFINLEDDFVTLQNAVLKSDLSGIITENADMTQKINGRYPLYDSNEDSIEIYWDYEDYDESYVSVNDSKIKAEIDFLAGADAADLNESDRYKELIVYDDGMSADFHIDIFRYNGEEIISLGSISGLYNAGDSGVFEITGPIWVNKKGIIVSPWQNVNFIEERFATAYFEIEDDRIIEKKIDCYDCFNKTYTVRADIATYFYETEDISLEDGAQEYRDYSIDPNLTLKKGDSITIIDADTNSGIYAVVLSDGRKGILYNWIGD